MNFKTLGICGGNGVILHPFRNGDLLGNIEPRTVFHTQGDVQWKANFRVEQDKTTNVDYPPHQVDVIVGAPDCGHSSVLSYSRAKKLSDPEDNDSLNFFIESVQKYKPKFFMMENLPKILDTFGSRLDEIFEGYRLVEHIDSVSRWGNSQVTRVRLIIVGVREDLPLDLLDYFKLPTEKYELKNTGVLLEGLELEDINFGHVREPDDFEVHLFYRGSKKIRLDKARDLWLGEYKDKKKWPVNHGNLKNQPGCYRNFEDDYPLTARKANRQFNHWGTMMSPRELARIQGIPDTFKLVIDPERLLTYINKGRTTVAKSPPYEIGLWFYKALNHIDLLVNQGIIKM